MRSPPLVSEPARRSLERELSLSSSPPIHKTDPTPEPTWKHRLPDGRLWECGPSSACDTRGRCPPGSCELVRVSSVEADEGSSPTAHGRVNDLARPLPATWTTTTRSSRVMEAMQPYQSHLPSWELAADSECVPRGCPLVALTDERALPRLHLRSPRPPRHCLSRHLTILQDPKRFCLSREDPSTAKSAFKPVRLPCTTLARLSPVRLLHLTLPSPSTQPRSTPSPPSPYISSQHHQLDLLLLDAATADSWRFVDLHLGSVSPRLASTS